MFRRGSNADVRVYTTDWHPSNSTGPSVTEVMLRCTGLHLKKDLNIACTRNTVKLLPVGISKLDGEELIETILKAPFLLIAGDESLRSGDKKSPIFVAFHDMEADAPWWGMLRICNMKDKTAETQASLFYDTIVNFLGYPRENFYTC